MSYQEICQVLDLKYQVARNYASRAIKQLKKVLWDKELLFSILYYCFNLHR
jgi:DNA-directed RNA polymerase specialized sigma24 family protein